MAKKNNIRSIRFSDEMIEMIESQAGDSFTAKFEALVTKCAWELPKKEEELRQIEATIERKRGELRKLWDYANKVERNANILQTNITTATVQLNRTIKELEAMLPKK
jgi:septal ring factor EnvC (AmiA/AmiB activator)